MSSSIDKEMLRNDLKKHNRDKLMQEMRCKMTAKSNHWLNYQFSAIIRQLTPEDKIELLKYILIEKVFSDWISQSYSSFYASVDIFTPQPQYAPQQYPYTTKDLVIHINLPKPPINLNFIAWKNPVKQW